MLFFLRKNNKETSKSIFIKYLSESHINVFSKAEKINNLLNRIKNEKNEISTNITGNVVGLLNNNIDISKLKLNIISSNDLKNNKNSIKALLLYNDGKIIDFKTLMDNDKIGIISDDIVIKYLGTKKSNLNNILNKIIDNSDYNFDLEDIENIKFEIPQISNNFFEKYFDIINKLVPENSFSEKKVTLDRKNKKLDVIEYTMTLDESKAIEIFEQLMKIFANDEEVLNFFDEQNKEWINTLIEEKISLLYKEIPNNNNVYTLKVYGFNNELYRISIDYKSEITIDIDFYNKENENIIEITLLENKNQSGYSLEIIENNTDVNEKIDLTLNKIVSSEIIGKINLLSEFENERKFI